jgi:hypothetical protein
MRKTVLIVDGFQGKIKKWVLTFLGVAGPPAIHPSLAELRVSEVVAAVGRRHPELCACAGVAANTDDWVCAGNAEVFAYDGDCGASSSPREAWHAEIWRVFSV